MWTLEDIKGEIDSTSTFLISRRITVPAEAYNQLECSMLQSLKNKIRAIVTLTVKDAVSLQTTFGQARLSSSVREQLQTLVDEQLAAAADIIPAMQQCVIKPQTLAHPWNYLTQSDWDVVMEESYFKRVMTICSRLRALGMASCHEQTTKWCVALLTCIVAQQTGKLPEYKMIRQMVLDFKATFLSTPMVKMSGMGRIVMYPENPENLPDDVKNAVYKDSQPVAKVFDQVVQIANFHIPLRATSKLLTVVPKLEPRVK